MSIAGSSPYGAGLGGVMAGDWLKMEVSTPEKPEVLAITVAMGWDDPDLTVGKLFKVWRWFDQHTESGNACSVSPALLDRIIGVSGLSQAMADVGWLEFDGTGITLPNFDRHNGKTAKRRAMTARRVAKHAANAKANAPSVSESVSPALPREEKRREEVKAKATVQPAAAQGDADGAKLPKRITGKKSAGTESEFARFWAAYPVKKGRAEAMKKWKAKGCDAIADDIIAHVRRMEAEDDQWKRGFIPHGSTYVNGELWNDEPYREKEAAAVTAPPPKAMGAKAALVQSETPLEAAVGYIRQQYSLGAYGEGEHALAEMQRLIAEATEKYRGSKNGEA